MRMIFQDPFASRNPRSTVERILEEPLIVQGRSGRRKRRERVAWLVERVGLRTEAAARYPHEFSGAGSGSESGSPERAAASERGARSPWRVAGSRRLR